MKSSQFPLRNLVKKISQPARTTEKKEEETERREEKAKINESQTVLTDDGML